MDGKRTIATILYAWNMASEGTLSELPWARVEEADAEGDDLFGSVYAIRGEVLNLGVQCGVGVPFSKRQPAVNEDFAKVHLRSLDLLVSGEYKPYLVLCSDEVNLDTPFATFCMNFINPSIRSSLVSNPSAWWRQWSRLIGNNDAEDMVYDVLGELMTLKAMAKGGAAQLSAASIGAMELEWLGPLRASCDIAYGDVLVEVKSSTVRDAKCFASHSLYQLGETNDKRYLSFCKFEKSPAGVCIDDAVSDLVGAGLNRDKLESGLDVAGFPQGRSARRSERFLLLDMPVYLMDETFPRITADSFVGGMLPAGISSIDYMVSLDGIRPVTNWLNLANDD